MKGVSLGNGYFIVSKMQEKWGPYWWLLKYIDRSPGHSRYEWHCLGPTIECKHDTNKPKLTLEEAIEEARKIMPNAKKEIPVREEGGLVA